MAILRQANLLGQQRVDVPTLRQVEASIAGDFDLLGGRTLAANRPLVIRGFSINTQGVVGSAANTLQLTTADGVVVNLEATESGSMLWIPTDRAADTLNATLNSNVVGSFTPSATNNIGIDFVRSADSTTADVVQFLDPNTKLETAKIVPLARTLNYRIVITTQPFSAQPNLIPIATVVTTAQNNVSSIVDARNMFGRLAPGGDFPSTTTGWSFSSPRTENATSSFTGPDKNFQGLKDWADAIMTRIWEVGGGQSWFSGTADRNVNFVFVGVPYVSGEYFTWDGTNLNWKGLRFIFDNSTGRYNDIANQTSNSAGLTDLADGECVYVDLKRDVNATGGTALQAVKGALATLGTGSPPGSRTIFAWRDGSNIYYRGWRFPVGQGFAPATTTTNGIVTLYNTPTSATNPVVLNLTTNGSLTWTASGGNATGLTVTGNGTGGGASFTGGATNGEGVRGTAMGTGTGVVGVSGPTNSSGAGVTGFGASSSNNPGLKGLGDGTGAGVVGTGGGTSGLGGNFTGGGPNGTGVQGNAVGNGAGGKFFGAGSGEGGTFIGGTSGPGVIATGGGVNYGVRAVGGNSFTTGADGAGIYASAGTNASSVGGYFEGSSGGGAALFAAPSTTSGTGLKANGFIDLSGAANPASNTGFVNRITPKNVCKAWASFSVAGSVATIQDGFNCTLAGQTGPTRVEVTFTQPMLNNTYSVALAVGVVEDGSHNIYNYTVENKLTTGFSIRTYLQGTGGTTFAGQNMSFQVFGAQ